MNQEQEVFFKILEQKMDELYGIMKHAPRIFPEQIHDCINYGGKIVNVGNHDELMISSEIYKEIYELQTRNGGKSDE